MTHVIQEISINGEKQRVPSPLTVEELLRHLSIDRRYVAVECNRKLIVKQEYAEAKIEAGDFLEIVTFVGGG